MLFNFINKLSNIIFIMVLGEGKLLGPLNRSGKSNGAGRALVKLKTGSRGEDALSNARGNPLAIHAQSQIFLGTPPQTCKHLSPMLPKKAIAPSIPPILAHGVMADGVGIGR